MRHRRVFLSVCLIGTAFGADGVAQTLGRPASPAAQRHDLSYGSWTDLPDGWGYFPPSSIAERQKMLDEAKKQSETPAQRKAALTEAITVNSEAGNRMLVDLMNRKGGGQSLDEQRLAIERRNQKLQEQSLAALEAVKENTSKPQLATKPFRPGA